MFRQRARSPLRWLWVVTSALTLLGLAGIAGTPWLALLIPPVVATILFAPPVGIFRHDERPLARTEAQIVSDILPALPGDPPSARRYLLTLMNNGDVVAEDFRIRLLVPSSLWPRGTRGSPLGTLRCGTLGTHWFIESVYDDTSVTFRAGAPGEHGALSCPPGASLPLAELVLVNVAHAEQDAVEYQINGGTVRTVLGRLQVRAEDEMVRRR